ncbi:hypothetical protein SAMN05421847_1316 [Halpernia humi]|uniref:TonB C-terminal domain-containing protein n=1 Tax=Halpernia humi TaxID=493375 RepID=A0A1H5WT08_9FLAO|nr:hypothetical protein [Halpernia humi]SEG02286.1 hypothetical protein SAMN05421847_1316 [Halpernia humi]
MKRITLIFFLITAFCNAQFDGLPDRFIPYQDGTLQFYKDLNTVLVKNNFKSCNNKESEMFLAHIEIDKKNHAKIINYDVNESNDCAKELFVKAFNEINKLNKWKYIPESHGKTTVLFYPIDYFENFKDGYTVKSLTEYADFPNGIGDFKKEFIDNFLKIQKKFKKNIKYEISFKIDKEGNMFNITANSENIDSEIQKNIIIALKQIKTKWSPEKFRGHPIISNFRMPFVISE